MKRLALALRLLTLAALSGCEPAPVCCINHDTGEIVWGAFEQCPHPFAEGSEHVCRSAWEEHR